MLPILTIVPITNPNRPKIIRNQFFVFFQTDESSLANKSKPAGMTRPSMDVVSAPPNDMSKSILFDIAAKPSENNEY